MAEAATTLRTHDNPETRRETSDVSARLVGVLFAGLFSFVVISIVILGLIFRSSLSGPDKGPTSLPPEPRLQTDPNADLAHFNAEAAARLAGYGYVDRANGIVHIPIDEAMKQIAAQGIPDWPRAAR